MAKPLSKRLRLMAEDVEDLNILSAHVQDAIVRVGDIAYLPKTRRLALTLNRFCWERAPEKIDSKDVYRRVTSGLHFDEVSAVHSKGIDRSSPEGLLYLLAVTAQLNAEPKTIKLEFAGGAELGLQIETIDARLADLNDGWLTENMPQHEPAGASAAPPA